MCVAKTTTKMYVAGTNHIFLFQMKLWVAALLLAFACYIPSGAEEESEARLLVSKNILNLYLVEGKDLTVEYRIFNVGGRSVATCISLDSPL